MEKAKRLLTKYGWKEGEGLGKDGTGMKEALKPKLKHDTNGVGYSHKEFPWWEHAYNKAAKTVIVESNDNGTSLKTSPDEDLSKNTDLETNRLIGYPSFCKGGTLKNGITLTEHEGPMKVSNIEIQVEMLSDEALFKICGGRTVHKGARHGLNLNGKLSRIEKQDKKLLKRLKNNKLKL